MSIIPFNNKARDGTINVAELKRQTWKLDAGLISPAAETTRCEIAPEHSAEPIKSVDDILTISKYLISRKRYRDNMLFIVGINFGLRVSDLRMLRFNNLINENLTFKESFPVFEQKTRNTRKRKKNRYITINHAVVEAVALYLENTPGVSLSDYMFCSESNNRGRHEIHGFVIASDDGKRQSFSSIDECAEFLGIDVASVNHICDSNESICGYKVESREQEKNSKAPLSAKSIDRILKNIGRDLNLSTKMSTHTLRKTFCYWMMVYGQNDPRRLLLLQKMLNHSSPAQTLDYIGITADEIDEAYKQLNLGSSTHNYLVDSNIVEIDNSFA